MKIDTHKLRRHDPHGATRAGDGGVLGLPPSVNVLVIGIGNSGEECALRLRAVLLSAGTSVHAVGINNDSLAPRPQTVRSLDGTLTRVELDERLVFDEDNPRSRLRDYPQLEQHYAQLLRNIPVFETYPRPGRGGHGYSVLADLDINLNSDSMLAFLNYTLRWLDEKLLGSAHQSDVQSLIAVQQRESARPKLVLICGGGTGAMGNAGHQIVPYLVRYIVENLGWPACELWGVILGPRAFSGLTPFVDHNYRALLLAIDALSRRGIRRRLANDLELNMPVPPYDRVFLQDDPRLPAMGTQTTETELGAFLDQTALNLSLLLRGTVWDTIAAHTANPDQRALRRKYTPEPRYLHTVQGVLMGIDRRMLIDSLAVRLESHIFATLMRQLKT